MNKMKMMYCPICGSTDVEVKMWVNPNEDQLTGCGAWSGEENDYWCNDCRSREPLMTLQELWEGFSDIPVNEDDEIEEGFLGFPVGTSKFDVWHWFDEHCPHNIHDDLM